LLRGLDFKQLLILVPILLISLTVHEICHGYAAYFLGDRTAKQMGRLSLNPIRHIDWIGFILLMTVGFGWAKPVPVNMNNFENPKRGMALTALAGPVSNIVLSFISAVLLVFLSRQFGNGINEYAYIFLSLMVQYNAMLAMFNFLPISPLDGSKILFAVLPNRQYYTLMQYERYGMIIMIILLSTNIVTPLLSRGADNLITAIFKLVEFLPI